MNGAVANSQTIQNLSEEEEAEIQELIQSALGLSFEARRLLLAQMLDTVEAEQEKAAPGGSNTQDGSVGR